MTIDAPNKNLTCIHGVPEEGLSLSLETNLKGYSLLGSAPPTVTINQIYPKNSTSIPHSRSHLAKN